ncbi:uncharacterized protein TNCV_4085831 [Trichonephila clavipes]|nr:uncharacterized protein TNCV_4085831 [Trichonephila clavipes]
MVSESVILLHGNARPHTTQTMQEVLRRFRWEIWSHFRHSEDLAPSNSFLFPRLKKHLSGRRFFLDNAVKTSIKTWLNGQGPDFYHAGLNKLVLRSDKCLNRLDDYVEK